ncbi:MAG: hypothetical protein ACFFB5_11985 [Promethearchaeota archaeon]
MARKIKTKEKNVGPAIDGDSPEIKEKAANEEIYKSDIEMRRNKDFSVNIFLYSYPIPLRYIKYPNYPINLIPEKEI